MRRATLLLSALLLGTGLLPAAAPPPPDIIPWMHANFFARLPAPEPGPGWNIAAVDNPDHGSLRVLVRSTAAATIELGEARPLYEIEEPFILVLGHTRADRPGQILFSAPTCTPEQWRALWAPVTYADLLKLEELIQDPARPIEETRRLVLRLVQAAPFNRAVIQVRPRITDDLRRLDCTLSLADFYRVLSPGAGPETAAPALWGVSYRGRATP
jgi:hypothetical protein